MYSHRGIRRIRNAFIIIITYLLTYLKKKGEEDKEDDEKNCQEIGSCHLMQT